MGYMKHHAIIVTSWNKIRVSHALEKAFTVFGDDSVSPLITSPCNEYYSFFVCPDGSKEGWTESADGDLNRAEFIEYLERRHRVDGSSYLDWAEVQYGDDNHETKVVRDSDQHERKKEPA